MTRGQSRLGTEIMQTAPGPITLARHGRPHADRTVRLDAAGYRDWWAAYDTVGLHPADAPPPDAIEAARIADVLYCSGLPRAMATARAVAPGRDVIVDPAFIEAALPPPPLPRFVRFMPPTWGVLSRIVWWLGYAPDVESRAAAEKRAAQAAQTLADAAQEGAHVMLFAHGWFNRMLRPHLETRGYVCVQDGGDGYWSFRTYLPSGATRRAGAFTLPAPADTLAGQGGGSGR